MTTLPSPRHHAQIIRLNESSLKEYIRLHESVWPEVLAAIHKANIRNYSIFLDEQNYTLFATFEYVGNDFEKDMEGVKDDEKTREWWELTDGMQTSFTPGAYSSAAGPPWWKTLKGVFYYSGEQDPPKTTGEDPLLAQQT